VPGVRFVNSRMQLLREIKTYVNSEGTETTQTFVRVGPSFSATAIGSGGFQSYTEELAPRGSGWEYIAGLDMPETPQSGRATPSRSSRRSRWTPAVTISFSGRRTCGSRFTNP